MAYVEVTAISKTFGDIRALDTTSFAVEKGEALCLFGPSGVGKTTILRIIAGLETPDGGAVHIGGEPVTTATNTAPPNTRNIGMVFQDRGLWPHMRAERHLDFVLKTVERDRAARRDRIGHLLESCRLTHRRRAYPHEMSGGEQQRLAIARALATNPALLLLDEPLNNLDTDLRSHFLAVINHQRQRGATLILATHSEEEVDAIGASVYEVGR